jgi:formaldehyde-activating enzyme
MMGQPSATRMFVIRDLNQMVRPATIMTTKVISPTRLRGSPGWRRSATIGDGIVDACRDICRKGLDEICMIFTVWLDPRCAEDPNLDKKDLYRTNYEATKIAIGRAMNGEPTVKELLKNRKTIKHYALEGVIDY